MNDPLFSGLEPLSAPLPPPLFENALPPIPPPMEPPLPMVPFCRPNDEHTTPELLPPPGRAPPIAALQPSQRSMETLAIPQSAPSTHKGVSISQLSTTQHPNPPVNQIQGSVNSTHTSDILAILPSGNLQNKVLHQQHVGSSFPVGGYSNQPRSPAHLQSQTSSQSSLIPASERPVQGAQTQKAGPPISVLQFGAQPRPTQPVQRATGTPQIRSQPGAAAPISLLQPGHPARPPPTIARPKQPGETALKVHNFDLGSHFNARISFHAPTGPRNYQQTGNPPRYDEIQTSSHTKEGTAIVDDYLTVSDPLCL